jgi:DNA (cytosine-5)-methyltransferase 1
MNDEAQRTIGSLFAGIGGFDTGFERAGWRTAWQVEINPINRAVLANRFPHARQFEDVRACGAANLSAVDCITAGFPCQDISNAGNSTRQKTPRGLKGARSGLFHEVVRILREIQPTWVVLENVPQLLASNDCEDIEVVIRSLAQCGYVGFWRVFDAQYFGVPQRRRRIFLVAGLGRFPSMELLADAAPVEAIPTSTAAVEVPRREDAFAGSTLSARNSSCRIMLGCEVLVAEENGWSSMVERERVAALHGIPLGLDDPNLAEAFAAGNAVVPPVAEWIARRLN